MLTYRRTFLTGCALLLAATAALAGTEIQTSIKTCETLDEDCPTCEGSHKLSPTGLLHLSWNSDFKTSALSAQKLISSSAHNSTEIMSLEDTNKLHSSMLYLCCYDKVEMYNIHNVLKNFEWASIPLVYDDFGCNLDHDGKMVYLHALPSESGQTRLLSWIREIEATFSRNGIKVNNPRKTLFHMTVARVTRDYPVDVVVNSLKGKEFGTIDFCCFEIDGIKYFSMDGKYQAKSHAFRFVGKGGGKAKRRRHLAGSNSHPVDLADDWLEASTLPWPCPRRGFDAALAYKIRLVFLGTPPGLGTGEVAGYDSLACPEAFLVSVIVLTYLRL